VIFIHRYPKESNYETTPLGKAALEISKVTDTIADISEQTNLLALNATIEATRAGKAGKGFAVVACEIKALAQQTAEATTEISSKIDGVQNTTKESVTAIEEQSATTGEISNNINQAASDVNENINQVSAVVATVNSDINRVSQATEEIKSCGLQVRPCATELSGLSKKLTDTLAQFTL
jgi:methyl-accepting chemotaxis protein